MTHILILLFSIQIIAANYFEELHLAGNTSSDLAEVSDTSVRSSFIEADKLYKKRGVDISYAKSNKNVPVHPWFSEQSECCEVRAARSYAILCWSVYAGRNCRL